jgi:hypothetical protein
VRHQEFHLIGQDAAVAQDEVLPQAGHIGRIQQRHVGLLGRAAAALAVVAGPAGGDHVHPVVLPVLRKRDDVFAREVFFVEMAAAVGADIAVAGEQLAVGQAGLEVKRVDVGHALGADDAVDRDHRLLARDGVVAAVEHRHLAAHSQRTSSPHSGSRPAPAKSTTGANPWADSFKTFKTRLHQMMKNR